MRTATLLALLACLLLAPSRTAWAQSSLSDAARISLLTVLPGDDAPNMYGHSALRVRDPVRGFDVTYNYGTYDFGDPFFIPKFVYGDMRYFLDVGPYEQALRRYRYMRRPIIEQVLDLSPEERDALFQALQRNAQPQNRFYAYDFFFDNCSTRVRDLLKEVLSDRLQFDAYDPAPQSFRQLIAPYAADKSALDAGMNLLLGTPTDQLATPWQTMFLPDYLMAGFDAATIERDGVTQSLVARTDTLYWAEGYVRARPAVDWPWWIGWGLFALALGATLWEWSSGRRLPPLPDALWLFAVGLVGVLLAFMLLVSTHAVTKPNLHLLWAWPTHLWAAAALLRGARPALLLGYLTSAALAALLVAAAWTLWPQTFPPAVLPMMLLVGLRAGVGAQRLSTTASGTAYPAR